MLLSLSWRMTSVPDRIQVFREIVHESYSCVCVYVCALICNKKNALSLSGKQLEDRMYK